jgi:hypothetical protein
LNESLKGSKKNSKIINNTGTRALRILASGMMAGITSPARQWFKLITPDPDMMNFKAVKEWLEDVERLLMEVFSRSNIYNGFTNVYTDLGAFGTSAMYIEEDDQDVLRAYTFPVGSYKLAQNGRFRVDTIYREMMLTVDQIWSRWGEAGTISKQCQRLWAQRQFDETIEVVHIIEPRRTVMDTVLGGRDMPYASTWYEAAADEDETLGEGGYEMFPVMCPRWAVTGEDTYGYAPGMDSLGDIRQLMLLEKRVANVMDKIVNPPLGAPTSLQESVVSLVPGEVTYYNQGNAGKVEPLIKVDPRALQIREEVERIEYRINSTFYADLFLLLANTQRPQKTAREVEELHEEKILQLGPVLERLHDELLDPTIDRAFNIVKNAGMLPQPPKELMGQPLRVEYISILAQAQKLLGTVAVERLTSYIMGMSEAWPEARHKLNSSKTVDEMGELLGTNPELLNDEEEMQARIEQEREAQQAEQAAAQAQAVQHAGAGAKSLSEAQMGDTNALETMLGAAGAG